MPGEKLDSAEVGVTYTGDATQLEAVTRSAQQVTAQLAQSVMQQAGVMRTAGVVMGVAGGLGMRMSNDLVRSSARVEAGYAKVNTMLTEGQDAHEDYSDALKEMARTLPVVGGEVALLDAQYQVLSAGFTDTADALHILDVATKASIGGMTSAEVAVDATTSVLQAYSLSASEATRVSDIMFTAIQRGKLQYEGLQGAIGPILSISAQMGMEFEQVASSLTTLTKAGVQIDIAGTAIRATLMGMMKPTEEMAQKIRELGYNSGSAMVQALGFQGSLDALAESVGHDQEALTELFPNIRALTAVLPLTGSMAETAREDLEALADSTGASSDAYRKMADTVEAEMTRLDNRLAMAMDRIAGGMTPVMMAFKKLEVAGAEALGRLNEETGGAVGGIISVGSAILATVGTIISSVAQYTLMTMAHMQVQAMMSQEIVTTQALTASKKQLAGASGAVRTATDLETASHMKNSVMMTKGQMGALKMSGGFMKLAGMAGPIAGVTLAVSGLVMGIGRLVKWYQAELEEERKIRASLRENLDLLSDGSEAYEEYADSIIEASEASANMTAELNLQAIDALRAQDSFVKGSKSALDMKQDWIDAQLELNEWNAFWDYGGDVEREIKEEAEELFGSVMSVASANRYLGETYDMTEKEARRVINATYDLTQAQLDETVALQKKADNQAQAMKDTRMYLAELQRQAEIQGSLNDWHREAVNLARQGTDELTDSLRANRDERANLVAISQPLWETDRGLAVAISTEIDQLDIEAKHLKEAISLKEQMTEATEDQTSALWEQITAQQEYLDQMARAYSSDTMDMYRTQITDLFRELFAESEDWAGMSEELFGEYAEDYGNYIIDALEGWQEAHPTGQIGADMIDEWIEGIKERAGYVDDTMMTLLQQFIMDYMGFSLPKKGPLRGIPESGGHLVQEYVGGMTREARRQGGMAGDVGLQVAGSVGGGGRMVSAPGRTINIYGPVTVWANDPVQFAQKMWDLVEEEAG